MMNLVKTEWLKIRKYRAFLYIMAVTAISYPGINYIFYQGYKDFVTRKEMASQVLKMLIGNPFTFPEVWHTVAFASSIFVFIPAVVVIMLITNEYTYKTHRQNIIDGWSRNQFLASKFIDVAIVSALLTILYVIVTLIIGYANLSESNAAAWSGSRYIGLFALQVFAQLSIAFLIAFLVRKAFIALGIFLFYFIILENFAVGLAHKYNFVAASRFFPFEISDKLVPVPAFFGQKFNPEGYKVALAEINIHILYTVLFTGLIWFICFQINKKRDL